jgi:hypothetical protein
MNTRKKLALPNGCIVQTRLLSSKSQSSGRTMLMSEILRENGISLDQVHVIDPEKEYEWLVNHAPHSGQFVDSILDISPDFLCMSEVRGKEAFDDIMNAISDSHPHLSSL